MKLRVDFPEQWLNRIPAPRREALLKVLAHDPRPSYQKDPQRVYGLAFAGLDIRFKVGDKVLTVCAVRQEGEDPAPG